MSLNGTSGGVNPVSAPIGVTTAVALMPNDFAQIWKDAKARYKSDAGYDLEEAPFATELRACDSVDDIVHVLDKREEDFKAFRAHGKEFRKVINPVVRVVQFFLDTGSEVAAVTGVPGGKSIFIAFGVLFKAANGVTQVYDALEQILSQLHASLSRLEVHLDSPLTLRSKLKELYVRTLACLLQVLGLFTKYIKKKPVWMRAKDFTAHIFGKTKVQDTLKELDKLITEEHFLTTTTTLDAIQRNGIKVDQIGLSVEALGIGLETVSQSVENLQNQHVDEKLYDWLKPPDSSPKQNELRKGRADGTGKWLFESTRFEEWRTQPGGIFWIHAKPGAGKSVLSSSVIDYLYTSPSHPLIAYHYFDFRDTTKQTASGLLTSIVVQLAEHSPECHTLLKGFRDSIRGRSIPDDSTLWNILTDMFHACRTVFIIIDALDECSKLLSSGDYDGWKPHVKEKARRILENKADGMFLWVQLQLDSLALCTATDVEDVLNNLPSSLPETYERILERYSSHPTIRSRIHRVLESVTFAQKPLTARAVAEIFDIPFDSFPDMMVKENLFNGDPEDFVQRMCPAILEVVRGDGGYNTVQFIHFSVKEYLLSSESSLGAQGRPTHAFHLDRVSSHGTLVAICVCALEPGNFGSLPDLRAYANDNWYKHVLPDPVLDRLKPVLSHFLDPMSPAFQSWADRFAGELVLRERDRPTWWTTPRASPLHWAAILGLANQADQLLQNGMDSNTLDTFSNTPLHWTAKSRQDELVELLHKYSAVLEAPNRGGNTPLHLAASVDSVGIASALLKCGVDSSYRGIRASVNTVNRQSDTPLHICCKNGGTELADLLLKSGASLHAVNKYGQMPLHLCCRYGHIGIVRLLLETGASLNAVDIDGETPLQLCCRYGHTDIIHLLLEGGASLNAVNNGGQMPLHTCCIHGRTEMARLLLKSGASSDVVDRDGKSPLHSCCTHGSTETARLLLESGAALNVVNEHGQTPLHFCCAHGFTEMAYLLLESGASPNAVDKDGETPLHFCCRYGRTVTARQLLKSGASPNAIHNDGQTPLHFCCTYGHTEMACLLLEGGVSFNALDNNNQTPLHLCCRYGRTDISRLLLERGASLTAVDDRGQTPLHICCQSESTEILRLLLASGAPIHVRNNSGLSPLQVVGPVMPYSPFRKKRGEETISLLLEYGASPKSEELHSVNDTHEGESSRFDPEETN